VGIEQRFLSFPGGAHEVSIGQVASLLQGKRSPLFPPNGTLTDFEFFEEVACLAAQVLTNFCLSGTRELLPLDAATLLSNLTALRRGGRVPLPFCTLVLQAPAI